MERRLAAILAADVVGYSRIMREGEAGTLATLKPHLGQLIEPKIVEHMGTIAPSCEETKLSFSSFVALVAAFILTRSVHAT